MVMIGPVLVWRSNKQKEEEIKRWSDDSFDAGGSQVKLKLENRELMGREEGTRCTIYPLRLLGMIVVIATQTWLVPSRPRWTSIARR
jgi:hypothetical protein